MVRRLVLPCLVILVAALPDRGASGAWMRDEGAGFLSFGLESGAAGPVQTVFLEFGMTSRVTLGLDAWRSAQGDWQALATVQVPAGPTDGASRVAASVGAGLGRKEGHTGPMLRIGAHFGRGLDTGWLAVDVSATHAADTGTTSAKASGTWGWNATDRCATILEARAETGGAAAVAPSLVCRVGDRFRLRLGGAQTVVGQGTARIGAQVWANF